MKWRSMVRKLNRLRGAKRQSVQSKKLANGWIAHSVPWPITADDVPCLLNDISIRIDPRLEDDEWHMEQVLRAPESDWHDGDEEPLTFCAECIRPIFAGDAYLAGAMFSPTLCAGCAGIDDD